MEETEWGYFSSNTITISSYVNKGLYKHNVKYLWIFFLHTTLIFVFFEDIEKILYFNFLNYLFNADFYEL